MKNTSHLHLLGTGPCSIRELLFLSQQGDALALERLYRTMVPIFDRFLRSRHLGTGEVEEVVQEVFCRIWSGRTNCISASGEAYLLGMAINIHREFSRQFGRIRRLDGNGASQTIVDPISHLPTQRMELVDLLKTARTKLSANEDEAVRLVYDGGSSSKTAAAVLGCSAKIIECRLRRARTKLKRAMESLL
jgi:RNA polymerase sigma factor (sigma-70 family)